jgi:hypothetical protein
MTPVEPLDPDTLAEGERLWGRILYEDDWTWSENESAQDWMVDHAAALLAVARDHARLTAEVKTLRGLLRSIGYGNVVNLLSAEAGDTDG